MVETKLMKNSDKVELTSGGESSLHSHAGGGGLPKYFYAEDDSEQSQYGTTWQQKLSLTIPAGNAGTYLIEGSFTYWVSANGYEIQINVVQDDSIVLHETIDGRIVATTDCLPGKFIKKVVLDANSHTFDVDFRMYNDTNRTGYMKECRLIARQLE